PEGALGEEEEERQMSETTRPRLEAPPHSCDTHMHIYDPRFPQAPGGPKPPGNFPLEAYRRMQARLGVSRVVIVQPNAYQDDNRCTLDASAQLGADAKGVGVVKLSAAYEVSKSGPPRYEDVGALARALVKAAPQRMLWASNWPHPTAAKDAFPDDANLLDLLLEWAPDEAVRRRILVDNPAEL